MAACERNPRHSAALLSRVDIGVGRMEQATLYGPHQGRPVLAAGEALGRARAAMIMLHGRGATAGDILTIAGLLVRPGLA